MVCHGLEAHTSYLTRHVTLQSGTPTWVRVRHRVRVGYLGVPGHSGVRHDQRPHHGHEEVLGGGLLLIREAQLRELAQLVAAPGAQVLCARARTALA